ncbi:hypothetical protein FVR03_23770 [Pontibacter qinzhouensis]|uniref:Uncharacterized protein n=1 Tax=Pontibacter qinzhouensis TaxID=2603253 RepID=A0A5C8IIC3_9BACT|nr:hypothetical protein [Pontibacter qinzhouensis]TXK20970.1 hypothetical protein FVR03_23770 [Pontibacter qinzhouensis]
MNEKQKQNLEALKQRNKQLEKALEEANLMILALHTMIEVAEKDLKISIRKKSGTKRSCPCSIREQQRLVSVTFVDCLVKAVKHFIRKGRTWISVLPRLCWHWI